MRHGRIKHKDKVYVRGDVHTNTVESAFSLFKRGLNGAFHKVSLKHLQRYLDEFGYRFNNRKAADLFGMTVARMANISGMPYSKAGRGECVYAVRKAIKKPHGGNRAASSLVLNQG